MRLYCRAFWFSYRGDYLEWLGHFENLPFVIASEAKQSTVSGFFFGIRCLLIATLVTLARNDIGIVYDSV